ncbi:TIM barrel protein [Acidaminobacterium chupaoyuni]
MLETISFPVCRQSMAEYESAGALLDECRSLGCDGIEAIWGGDDAIEALPKGIAVGYHLTFYPDWVDFFLGDRQALLQKFGSMEACRRFYGGENGDDLICRYRADLARAARVGARYVVVHLSDVSLEEGYTYRWRHSHQQVLEAGVRLINRMMEQTQYPFELLIENQWWPGFTFTNPRETAFLIDHIAYPGKGIMLDIGHLMNTQRSLRTQAQGAEYVERMLEAHGELCRYVRGIHLHQSLSGKYVERTLRRPPPKLSGDYAARYSQSYSHIVQIDRHQPWEDPAIGRVIRRAAPQYLTHELAAPSRAARAAAVAVQKNTIRKAEAL